LGRQCLYTW